MSCGKRRSVFSLSHDKALSSSQLAQSFPGVSCIPVVLKDTVLLEPGKEYLVRAFSTVMEEEKDYLFIPDHGNLEKGASFLLIVLFVIDIFLDFRLGFSMLMMT